MSEDRLVRRRRVAQWGIELGRRDECEVRRWTGGRRWEGNDRQSREIGPGAAAWEGMGKGVEEVIGCRWPVASGRHERKVGGTALSRV